MDLIYSGNKKSLYDQNKKIVLYLFTICTKTMLTLASWDGGGGGDWEFSYVSKDSGMPVSNSLRQGSSTFAKIILKDLRVQKEGKNSEKERSSKLSYLQVRIPDLTISLFCVETEFYSERIL